MGECVAEVIVAETGADISRLSSSRALGVLGRVRPGHHESAGKRRSGKTRHGNRWPVGALGTAAIAAAGTKDTAYFGACYRRLAPRRGKTKAIVVVGYSILVAVRQMRTNDVGYADLGGVYFARLHPNARCTASCVKPTQVLEWQSEQMPTLDEIDCRADLFRFGSDNGELLGLPCSTASGSCRWARRSRRCEDSPANDSAVVGDDINPALAPTQRSGYSRAQSTIC